MSLIISITVTFLFGCGFYLILKKGLLNRAFGLFLISHGANYIIMNMSGYKNAPLPPILENTAAGSFADPLPQALILTALVIGFAMAAFLWALILRLGKEGD